MARAPQPRDLRPRPSLSCLPPGHPPPAAPYMAARGRVQMLPAFTSPQPTCGYLPPRPSQQLPDTAAAQVRPGPRPHYLQAPTLLRPGLTLNWLLKSILLSSWKSQRLTVPSSVLHAAPHTAPPAPLAELRAGSSRGSSVSHLSSAPPHRVSRASPTACHHLSRGPSHSSQLPQVTHTCPPVSSRIPTQVLTWLLS